MNYLNILALVSLGIRVALKLLEERTGKPVDEMTDAEMAAALREIEIQDTDKLLEGTSG